MAGMHSKSIVGLRMSLATALAAVAFVTLVVHDRAEAQGRHAALIVDGNTGRALSESNADEPRYPASLTKMMTLYVLFELIEQKKLTYDTPIVFSQTATRVQPSKLGLTAGESITALEAAKALIAKSANDVAVAVAEHIAGSEQKFAAVMTQTARRIGMKSTTFKNAHGLPDSGQVTTARDMVTLGLRLQDDFPKHYRLFSTRDFSHGNATYRNHNTLLLTYEGTDGIKTGYIGSSGFNLVANVKRGDKHVIGVVFGGATAGARNNTMKTLLNMGLIKASAVKTRSSTPIARARAAPVPTVLAPAVATRPQPDAMPKVVAAAAPVPIAPPTKPANVAPANVADPVAETPTAEVQIARVRPLLVAPRPPAQAPTPAIVPQAQTIQLPPLATGLAPATTPALQAAALPGRPNQGAAAQSTAPPGASRLNGPTLNAPTPANAVHLQVGAYASKADADKQLATVRNLGGATVAALAAEAIQATSNGKSVFRARFTGVDPAKAGTICNDLRRRQVDCMVTRPD